MFIWLKFENFVIVIGLFFFSSFKSFTVREKKKQNPKNKFTMKRNDDRKESKQMDYDS